MVRSLLGGCPGLGASSTRASPKRTRHPIRLTSPRPARHRSSHSPSSSNVTQKQARPTPCTRHPRSLHPSRLAQAACDPNRLVSPKATRHRSSCAPPRPIANVSAQARSPHPSRRHPSRRTTRAGARHPSNRAEPKQARLAQARISIFIK